MPFMLPLEPLLKAEQDCSDSNPNLPPPPHTRTQARTHPRVRTRTHAHTHKCTRTHVRARTRMLEPTPFHTPLLTPGSPDPPALPTAPRWRHHGLGVPSAPSSAAPFPAHDGQRWGCTGQASSPRSPPGGGLRPGRGGGAARPHLRPRWPALWPCVDRVSARACARAGGLLSALLEGDPSRAQARLRQLCWASPSGPAPRREEGGVSVSACPRAKCPD